MPENMLYRNNEKEVDYHAVIHFTSVATYLYRFEDSLEDVDENEEMSDLTFEFSDGGFLSVEGNINWLSFDNR